MGNGWWIACGEVLYEASIDFIHDSDLLDSSMHLMMNALKIGVWLVFIIRCAMFFRGLLALGI